MCKYGCMFSLSTTNILWCVSINFTFYFLFILEVTILENYTPTKNNNFATKQKKKKNSKIKNTLLNSA